jgi:glutamyl-tRNA synthetase
MYKQMLDYLCYYKFSIMEKKIRVRFAPSPTGALHIGGVRTALFNYLFAKKHGGAFILRIEDTDQSRYVPGAEDYIIKSLEWLGIRPDEGPGYDGDYGPYRQSDRKEIYAKYAFKLVDEGRAYYAFDSVEDLNKMRDRLKDEGNSNLTYNASSRKFMCNSLTMNADELKLRLENKEPYVIRMKIPDEGEVMVNDLIRSEVTFNYNDLDDKVILKADGMPTYHLANVVDDHLMEISHVIRGEEWLSSAGHHILLHQYLGWRDTTPAFAHLPLILKPDGKGKLSKRDGVRLGIPVFPLSWNDPDPAECFTGFKEVGFEPEAVVNFLALLGWNSGTEQEIFSIDELSSLFSLDRVAKGGAKFDIEKAKWFNHHYLRSRTGESIAQALIIEREDMHNIDPKYLEHVSDLLKERVDTYMEIPDEGMCFFKSPENYDQSILQKKWNAQSADILEAMAFHIRNLKGKAAPEIEMSIKKFIEEMSWSMGSVFPLIRLAIAGKLQGPDLFSMIELIGTNEVADRLVSLKLYGSNL